MQLDDRQMDALLTSHALLPELLRRDAFDEFLEDRRRRLTGLIERAMGKPVSWIVEDDGADG